MITLLAVVGILCAGRAAVHLATNRWYMRLRMRLRTIRHTPHKSLEWMCGQTALAHQIPWYARVDSALHTYHI